MAVPRGDLRSAISRRTLLIFNCSGGLRPPREGIRQGADAQRAPLQERREVSTAGKRESDGNCSGGSPTAEESIRYKVRRSESAATR